MTTYDAIISTATKYLEEKEAITPEKSVSSAELATHIIDCIANETINISATQGTILNYLSRAANQDPSSKIRSGGPHGGYWLNKNEQVEIPKQEDIVQVKEETGEQISFSEKDLYPLMTLWLAQQGYLSKDTSTTKSGGKWGNPDIVGIDRVEIFGSIEIEVASLEIKLSEASWEQFIFEAVSHKRFSNRSWFCYRTKVANQPLPKGMEYYAERFRVGILQVELSDQELANLKKGEQPITFIDNVKERFPALYDATPLEERRGLMSRSNVSLTLSF